MNKQILLYLLADVFLNGVLPLSPKLPAYLSLDCQDHIDAGFCHFDRLTCDVT